MSVVKHDHSEIYDVTVEIEPTLVLCWLLVLAGVFSHLELNLGYVRLNCGLNNIPNKRNWHCSSSPLRQSTGNDISGLL